MSDQISIIGLGYVGLPLAVAAANSGYAVIGVDKDSNKIKKIVGGSIDLDGINQSEIASLINTKKLILTTEYKSIARSEIIIICVPTPLTANHKPDLDFVLAATAELAQHMKRNALIILESTVSPGTTREILAPLIESKSNFSADDYLLVFSPERIDPANSTWGIKNTPKLVAGTTIKATNKAKSFYSKFIDDVIVCESIEIAETAKLLENSFRLLNIAFVNELSTFCSRLGIDLLKVIEAASSKPYGFMPFYPSLGAGGHCIPVDPVYLTNRASEMNTPIKILELAQEINLQTPKKYLNRLEHKIGTLSGKKILVIGISYKANVADVRESSAVTLINELRKKDAIVSWHDDLVGEWNGEKSVNLDANFDFAILASHHTYLNLNQLNGIEIYDCRSSLI